MAQRETWRSNSSDADIPPAPGQPSSGNRRPPGYDDQATTVMSSYRTEAEEAATSASNRKLVWVLAGGVVVVGVLLVAVFGRSNNAETPPLVQTPVSATQADTPPATSIPPVSVANTVPTPTTPTTLPPLTTVAPAPKPAPKPKPKPITRRTVAPKVTHSAEPSATARSSSPRSTRNRGEFDDLDNLGNDYGDRSSRRDPYSSGDDYGYDGGY